MSSYIPFRLREPKDDDIKKWIAEELDRAAAQDQEMDRSDVIRAALRFYFQHKHSLPHRVANGFTASPTSTSNENPVEGTQQTDIDLQHTPMRESFHDAPTQQKEAARFPNKLTAPYLSNQKRRN